MNQISKWAEEAKELLASKARIPAAILHRRCNDLLYRLRCGTRRRRYSPLRKRIRDLRTKAAKRL